MSYPPNLAEIVDLFEHLPEEEKRENLIAYADGAANCALKPGEKFDLEDTRKDDRDPITDLWPQKGTRESLVVVQLARAPIGASRADSPKVFCAFLWPTQD